MDWTHVIDLVTLLTAGGGLYALVTVQDKKTALMLDNIKAMLDSITETNEAWENLAKQKLEDIAALEEKCNKKDQKIDELYKMLGAERTAKAEAEVARAIAETLKCQTVGCSKRIPPFGIVPEINTEENES